MLTLDWPALLASILRCDAAYCESETLARAEFAALGASVIAWCSTATHQAVLSVPADGIWTLTMAGTRLSEGSALDAVSDIWQDADFVPTAVEGGRVASGAFARGRETFAWALALLPQGQALRVEGHSLAGQTAHLAPLFVPASALHSMIAWEPPKAADMGYYAHWALAFTKCRTIVNGRDPWAAWPWGDDELLHPPGPLLWLHDGNWMWTGEKDWLGGDIGHYSDHDTEQVIMAVRAAGKL